MNNEDLLDDIQELRLMIGDEADRRQRQLDDVLRRLDWIEQQVRDIESEVRMVRGY